MATFQWVVIWTQFVLFLSQLAILRTQKVLCPAACSCLGILVDCNSKGLIEIPKDLPEWVEILELKHNGISHIADDAFLGLKSLKHLDLSHNNFKEVNGHAFRQVPSLEKLEILHNQLTEIPDMGLLANLTELHLMYNEIHTFNTALSNYPKLQLLNLSFNRIVDIPVGTFQNNSNLTKLLLFSNKIVNIENGSLDDLTSLELLELSKNRIAVIPKDLFRNLTSLKHIKLDKNRIQSIEGLSFKGLVSLESLSLKRNSINHLSDGSFWGLGNIQVLHLDHNNISTVTKGWLYGLSALKQLTLSYNRITDIGTGEKDFWEFCVALTDLDLTSNRLQAITKATFSKLDTLRALYLDHNIISYIEEGAFKNLKKLHNLQLNNNEISWSIEDTNGPFDGLSRLKILGLATNYIKSITARSFVGLSRLRTLNLSHNPITSIEEGAFAPLHKIQDIKINTSNLLCDCKIRWLPDWLMSMKFQDKVKAKCGHPDALKNKTVFEIDPSNFTCDDFPKPYIIESPKTQIALKGENLTLVCKAGSTSGSGINFLWRKEYKLLTDKDVKNFAQSKPGGMTEYESLLHLYNIQDKDGGRYQCVISSKFGPVYSEKADITVHVFPTFVKTPVDITVKAGSTARLECAAKGQPQPVIAWQKDGGDDFPAARERRMHVMPSDDVFFIVSVKTSDMGMYSCTATNLAGTIMANASLTVLEAPSFVHPMKSLQTNTGEPVVLECFSSGSPKPKLTWLKDGAPLIPTKRHFFAAESQLLIIMHSQASDEGEYSCEMSNTLGTERGTSFLKILPAQAAPCTVSCDSESTTAGIVIIVVVCCVVGTSLIWVIIIYKTRKRREDYASANMNDPSTPCENEAYSPFLPNCKEEVKSSVPQTSVDSHSERSNKESSQQSTDEFLSQDDESSQTFILGGNKGAYFVRGHHDDGISSASQTPPTPHVSSGGGSRHTFHLPHKLKGSSLPITNVEIHQPPLIPPGEVSRWHPQRNTSRSLSEEHLPKSGFLAGCRGLPRRHLNNSSDERDSGFATFPRSISPASAHRWSSASLHIKCLPKEIPNDSGSFSIVSGDSQASSQSSSVSQEKMLENASCTTESRTRERKLSELHLSNAEVV